MTYVLGIDLGTTNSCAALWREGGPAEVVTSALGERTTPSVVAFTDKATLVGTPAVRQAPTNALRTYSGLKRLIGRKTNHPDIGWFASSVGFEIAAATNGDAWVRDGSELRSPQEIASLLLAELKARAEASAQVPITQTVITVPAYFNDAQRQATRTAGTLAGLDVIRIVNEPTAAALAYGVHRVRDAKRTLAVVDLGGGTFDVSIMVIEDRIFEVLSTNGDMTLGGNDWDTRIALRLAEEFFTTHGIDLSQDPTAKERLRSAAEDAKKKLSNEASAEIRLLHIASGKEGSLELTRTLRREEFESLTADLCSRLEDPCKKALSDAGIGSDALDDVLLVGGMTRIPAIRRKIAEVFGRAPSQGAHPDEVVALGAATVAGMIAEGHDDAVLIDVLPHSIGVRVGSDGFSPVVSKNSILPARGTRRFSTTRDNQTHFRLELYQGEENQASNNKKIGEVILDNLPPGDAGSVQIELTVNVDIESLVHLGARELSSGRQSEVEIRPSSGLSGVQYDEIIDRRRRETGVLDFQ